MQTGDFLMLLGGLALFLYGMQMMSSGLEAAAGNRMKSILEKLTSGRIRGVLVGAGITAVIQSSSATTVMVVGFVSAGLMSLNQAVGVIMGANIGTTVTGQLIALDVSAVAPLITFAGVVMMIFIKGEKTQHIGNIIAGLGVLFIGMDMMSTAMEPLQDSPAFIRIVTSFDHPVIGILVGAVFTALIQSSSASVGILQALAAGGVIGLPQAVYVLFGQNIGTCITAVLASIGTKINARRSTLIHLMFNVIGTILFTGICLATPFVSWMENLTPGNPMAQIANVHTVFNVVTTLILLPFGGAMAKLAVKILPGDEEEEQEEFRLVYLQDIDSRRSRQIGQISVSVSAMDREISRMFDKVEQNVDKAFSDVLRCRCDDFEEIRHREEYIDFLNSEISGYIARVIHLDLSAEDSARVSSYFRIVGNLERIGDHAMNIGEYACALCEGEKRLSPQALQEIGDMKKLCMTTLQELKDGSGKDGRQMLKMTAMYEQRIDDMSRQLRENQISRMKKGQCSAEAGVLYSELVTDFERIGDHALNIAEEYSAIL
ncbi:MAG: Na/Pi cotransporter family protein [Emergencia sp.]